MEVFQKEKKKKSLILSLENASQSAIGRTFNVAERSFFSNHQP